MVAFSPLQRVSAQSSLNVPVLPPLPSTAMWYSVPATTFSDADVAPDATEVSAPSEVPV